MKKLSVLSLILALILILGGCAVSDDAAVIIVNGESVTRGDMMQEIDSQLNYNQQLNAMYQAYYGFDPGLTTDRNEIANELINTRINILVSLQKAKELGFDQLTAQEEAQLDSDAQDQYDYIIAQTIPVYFPDLSGDEATKAAQDMANENGVTVANYRAELRDSLILSKLQNDVVKDVTVDENAVTTQLEANIAQQKTMFDETPSLFGDYYNQQYDTLYYAPEGFRVVKHVLIQFTDEDATIINQKMDILTQAAANVGQAKSDGTDLTAPQAAMDEAQAALDAARETARNNIQAKVDEVLALVNAENADFDALIEKYSEDTGMPATGYAVKEGYESFVEVFTKGAMSLEKVGDVSAPVYSDYGCHIIRYEKDIPAGNYEQEAARTAVEKSLLSAAQEERFFEELEKWINASKVKVYTDRLK